MGIISECMYLGMYVDMYAYTFVFGWVDMDVCVHALYWEDLSVNNNFYWLDRY